MPARVRRAAIRPLCEQVGRFAKPEFPKAHINTRDVECPQSGGIP
jgi:hypothetical protein